MLASHHGGGGHLCARLRWPAVASANAGEPGRKLTSPRKCERTKNTFLFVFVAAGLLVATMHAARPRYGGTLRVETEAAIHSYDPAIDPVDTAERAGRAHLIPLVFESLVA